MWKAALTPINLCISTGNSPCLYYILQFFNIYLTSPSAQTCWLLPHSSKQEGGGVGGGGCMGKSSSTSHMIRSWVNIFLISLWKHMLWVLRSPSPRCSNEYPQCMFPWRNKQYVNTFCLKKKKKKNLELHNTTLVPGIRYLSSVYIYVHH